MQEHSGHWRTEERVSAGGVVYRETEGVVEIVLCGRYADGVWGLPKGTPREGEDIEETALREVNEETGLEVAIVERIGEIHYWFSRPKGNVRYRKTVHHYLMRPLGGSVAEHDHEYDTVEWFPVEQALKTLSYANEVEVARKACLLIEKRKISG